MKLRYILLSLLLMGMLTNTHAFWNNNNWNNGWNNGWSNNWNPYDVWDPRYWAEEMEDMFDNDDWWGNGNNYYQYPNYGMPVYRRFTPQFNENYLPVHNPYLMVPYH